MTVDSSNLGEQLANTGLFRGLEPQALAEVATVGRVEVLPRGTVLFTQGARADRAHVLLSGCMRIAQSGPEGGKVIVRFVGPGATFGTAALFTDKQYPADATALVDSVEISWPQSTLLELMHRYPQIAFNLVGVISARLREVQERLRELATQPVDQRVAQTLLRLADQHPGPLNEDAVIDFPLTRQDVADLCGATLYTVSRVLTAWEKAGYINTHRKRVRIQRLEEIRRLARRAAF